MSFPDFSSAGKSTLFLCAERMGVVCVFEAVNIETLRNNEPIVAQMCECPFVKYCIVIAMDFRLAYISRSWWWRGGFV